MSPTRGHSMGFDEVNRVSRGDKDRNLSVFRGGYVVSLSNFGLFRPGKHE